MERATPKREASAAMTSSESMRACASAALASLPCTRSSESVAMRRWQDMHSRSPSRSISEVMPTVSFGGGVKVMGK
jgi:hypothetical protein